MPSITVRDIQRLALPGGTTLLAGAGGLNRQVVAVAALRATPPAFGELHVPTLALVPIAGLAALGAQASLSSLIRRLSQAPIVGVVVLGEVTGDDVGTAEAVRLPLLQLPDGSNMRDVEREVARLIGDYEAQLERRAAQLYAALSQRALAGDGLAGLLEELGERTGQGFAAYAASGELRAIRARGAARIALQALKPSSRGDASLLSQRIWIEPAGGGPVPAGYLAVAGAELDHWDRLAAVQGATALGLEIAKEQAVQAAEDRLRGDFLHGILSGAPADAATLLQRGEELGYDLRQPYVAMICQLDGANILLLTRMGSAIQAELARRGVSAPQLRRDGSVLVMLPHPDHGPRPRDLADAVRTRLQGDNLKVTVALGTTVKTLGEWPRTLEEAEQALRLGRELLGTDRVLAFADLGVYRLLVRLRETTELWAFYRETLAALAAYDQRQGGELLKTLEAYFNHLGNLRASAMALHVHRNTLLYRLDRIKQISGLDLEDAEEHFALWLALKAHRVLKSLDTE